MIALPPAVPSSSLRRGFRPVLTCVLKSILLIALPGAALCSSSVAHAQSGRAGLISEAVNEGRRVVLYGNTHPLATREADRGEVEASLPADRMLLMLKRSPEQELALRAMIQSAARPEFA